jgi:SAM-dependent methyltransferase
MAEFEPYTFLARFYDSMSGREGFKLYAPAYEELMARLGLGLGKALDAACGTGLWTHRLAELGWTVIGVNRSLAMLREAGRRCRGLEVSLLCQDILELSFEGRFDLVTCTYDSLNYLPQDRDLVCALGRLAQALKPGGVAIFDTNTTRALRDRWATQSFVKRAGKTVSVWSTRWDRRSRSNRLTIECFSPHRGGHDLYDRHVEVHLERALDPDRVRAVALEAGFDLVEALDAESLAPADRRTAKAIFVGRTKQVPWQREPTLFNQE